MERTRKALREAERKIEALEFQILELEAHDCDGLKGEVP